MTALDHPTTHAPAGLPRAASAVARVFGGLAGLLRALRNRRQIGRLRDLSDHQLADIGLTRSDLVVAMHAPLGADPTTRLGTLARERYWTEFGARHVC